MKFRRIALLVILLSGCSHKAIPVAVVAPLVNSGPPPQEVAYREGLQAFRTATMEGYQHAAVSFRRASELSKDTCEYALHLAESLYFLADKQKLNWEDFGDTLKEANAVIEFKNPEPHCGAFESYVTRLRTLRGTFTGARSAESVALIGHAIDADPDDPMNWVVLSQVRAAPLPGDTLAPSEHAARLAPDFPLVQFELGNYYLSKVSTESFSKAKAAYEQTLERSPRHVDAIVGIVHSLALDGDNAANQIEPLLKKAIEIAPTSLKARMALGDYYAGFEETEKALEQYKAASDFQPRYYPAYLSTGTTLVTAERSEEAKQFFIKVIQLEVNKPHPPFNVADFAADAQTHYYLGNIWLVRNDLVQARLEFDASIADISNYAPAIYGLGIVSYQESKLDEALRHLDRVIQISLGEYPNAYLVRGGIKADRRQFPEALKDLKTAVDIYRQQTVSLEAKAQVDDARGFKRRAEGERRRKKVIEGILEQAQQVLKKVETLMGPGEM